MSNFDCRIHKIVGVARRKYQGALHANIYPLGYQDSNYHFQKFSEDERRDIFLHSGTVFGYKFPEYWTDQLIAIDVKEDEFENDPSKDLYLVASKPAKYDHVSVVNTNKDGLKETIKQCFFNTYYKVGGRIYYITKIDSDKGIAKYWPIEDELFKTNDQLCQQDDDIYLIRGDINYPCKYSDILSQEEIITYVIDLIKLHDIDINNINNISKDLIKSIEIPCDILNFRFDVFKELLPSIALTQKHILELASNPILIDVLQRSIKEYEDEYIRTYEEHHRERIKKIEQSKEQKLKDINEACEQEREISLSQLKSINDDIDKAQVRLNEINEKIKRKEIEAKSLEQRFLDIEEHKGRLIEDFSMIKDVIGGQAYISQKSLMNCIERVIGEGESILAFDDFCSHIAAHLLNNKFSEDSAIEISKNISRLFVAKNPIGKNLSVILLPSLKIFKSLIDAIGQYRLCSIGVAPNWKSYEDLYCVALDKMVISAISNPDEIHIVLLQNMNLSYIPSYMRPINDILIGISSKLPGDHDTIGIPSNMWIFGTRTGLSEEAIPISRSNIEEYGCLENKEYTYSDDKIVEAPECKFITMDFVHMQRDEERRYKSMPDSYVD